MQSLSAYLPQDRLKALSQGADLPARTRGTALFADISGFTPLTETLANQFGSRRGVEELTRQINMVYDALVNEVDRFGGSVIGFAGDSITCWFDSATDPAGPARAAQQAVSAALGMQTAMRQFPGLGLKVSAASGAARRFVAGDPAIQCLDVLAGEAVIRSAAGERLAKKGEVLLDEATARALGEELATREWRTEKESGERFALAATYSSPLIPTPDPERPILTVDASILRPFLLPAIFEREVAGQGAFLTEFRPCVVLFVRFTGLDYDAEQAQTQLDAFIRQAQAILTRYEGTLLQLTVGDKGSYLYINFGVLAAHEDDARRAVTAALELRQVSAGQFPSLQLQMGITRGVLRVGAYGGQARRSYGALGDEVNLAARLMSTAAAGEILVSGKVRFI